MASGGGGLKGLMMLAMVFVFGGAAYVAARDFESDICEPFLHNSNVERRVGDVTTCGVDLRTTLGEREIVLAVKGGAGNATIRVQRKARRVMRAYLTTPGSAEPELVLGADPMVSTSRVLTR
jgi:hypothetical protein